MDGISTASYNRNTMMVMPTPYSDHDSGMNPGLGFGAMAMLANTVIVGASSRRRRESQVFGNGERLLVYSRNNVPPKRGVYGWRNCHTRCLEQMGCYFI